MPKYGVPIWKHVLNAAEVLNMTIFSPRDIVAKIHEVKPKIPATSIRTYVIAMAPNHPSSYHYPSTRKNHPYFQYLGNGKFKLARVRDKKQDFLEEYEATILDWTDNNLKEIISGRKSYSWGGKSLIECLDERNRLSRLLILSRIRNEGGVDLKTLDKVMSWGGFGSFPLREEIKVLEITRQAFSYVDEGNLRSAISELLKVYGVGIASASKIIGLYDQNSLAIYDSRVGTALRPLTHDNARLLKCPPGRSRPGDTCTKRQWAEYYEKLLWTLKTIRNHLNSQGYPFSIADVEMALFMIGKKRAPVSLQDEH